MSVNHSWPSRRFRIRANGNGVVWSVRALLAVVLIASGACAAFLISPEPTPGELDSTSVHAVAVRASSESYDDSRDVKVTVTPGSGQNVTFPTSGVVTSIDCTAGATIASGTSFVSVDGVPLLALATDTPPYRDLTSGVKGDDARSLNDALRTLGYAAPNGNMVTWNTITAFNRAAGKVGAAQVDAADGWTITPESFVWLDAPSATLVSCQTAKGSTIAAGGAMMTVRTQPARATVAAPSDETVTGKRVLVVDDQPYDLPAADGAGAIALRDPSVIAAIVGSDAYRSAASSATSGSGSSDSSASSSGESGADSGGATVDGGSSDSQTTATAPSATVTVTLTSRLQHPVTVWDVPPSSIYGLNGTGGCVVSDGKNRHVTIVASELGKTKVTVAGNGRLGRVLAEPAGSRTC
ncbi:hypothetical protein JS528_05180 [Bifidobacterium sp. MA2]|uniref:Peptidoglycan-binding domain 1 protein n=1 Tax=Bifidobacterium santillanense TaxID=2809028 RepID=A0ABS5UPE9_9BIFI|nr:hypothetical protein [Bifidobacterium santillanense]MBT1172754.1 hypothetical protein [Bifidobacterium santillanense]